MVYHKHFVAGAPAREKREDEKQFLSKKFNMKSFFLLQTVRLV